MFASCQKGWRYVCSDSFQFQRQCLLRLTGSLTGGFLTRDFYTYVYQQKYKCVPSSVLVLPSVAGSVIGGVVYPVSIGAGLVCVAVVGIVKYDKWVEQQIEKAIQQMQEQNKKQHTK